KFESRDSRWPQPWRLFERCGLWSGSGRESRRYPWVRKAPAHTPRRDGALVDIEEGDIVVGGLMKEDDELDEVGVRLLPERFLATAEKVVQERGDVVSEGVRVQVIVERVVAVFGIEADFDVIL